MARRPLIIAHRGVSAVAYENSLEAFRAAVALDALGVDRLCTHDPARVRAAFA